MPNINGLQFLTNKVSRNGFDLSSRNLFTAAAGGLYPCFMREIIPGDEVRLNVRAMSRTMPVNTAAFARMVEHYEFFFVPYDLLLSNIGSFFQGIPNQRTQIISPLSDDAFTQLPTFTTDRIVLDVFNKTREYAGDTAYCNRIVSFINLLAYLGYGVHYVTDSLYEQFQNDFFEATQGLTQYPKGFESAFNLNDVICNPLPLLAYQKIYSDFYRNDPWESPKPSSYNIDYTQSVKKGSTDFDATDYVFDDQFSTPFDFRYRDFAKDLFTGLLPNSQYGTYASVAIGQFNAMNNTANSISYSNSQVLSLKNAVTIPANTDVSIGAAINGSSDNTVFPGLNVLNLRKAQAMQRYLEIKGSAGDDVSDLIYKHFGVKQNPVKSHKAQFLGGRDSLIQIGEVLNNNFDSADSEASIKGRGVGYVGQDGYINFHSDDYGVIIGIYSVEPKLDFRGNLFHPLATKSEYTDFAIPELDSIGLQSVYSNWFSNILSTPELEGYASRYIEYKTALDTVNGEFLDSLKSWTTTYSKFVGTENDFRSFKIRPSYLNNIFVSQSVGGSNIPTQFMVNAFFDCKMVRNLDFNGLPY